MIEIRNLVKKYAGGTMALQGVSFRVGKGDMFGLIGPNGAGKTTLIRILATLLPPTAGEAHVSGHSVRRDRNVIRRIIGYLPDSFGVYEEMRVVEYLEFFASAYGIREPKRSAAVNTVLELTDLTGKRKDLIGTLSRGMQQRLGLARVLVHDPEVLLLDEPASGLDPRARIEIRALLKELRKLGKTILISSHILADLADLCNRIAMIEQGKVLYVGDLTEALGRVSDGREWLVEVDRAELAQKHLSGQSWVESVRVEGGRVHVSLKDGGGSHQISELLVREGVQLRSLRQEEATLEDAFLKITRGEVS